MNDSISKSPETIEELIRWSTKFLEDKGFASPRLDTELLLCHVLNCRRIDLYLRFDQPLSRAELGLYKSSLIRRLNHEPVAYILGYKEFMSLKFKVDSSVLIPRPETELLVERILECAKEIHKENIRILEIGTGSGCIALSLLHHLKNASVVGMDVSEKAVGVCCENARNLNIEANRYQFLQRDALDEKSWMDLGNFDIIVSNPPYISVGEKAQLPRSVVEFEPELALIADSEGLAFYKCIAHLAPKHISENAKVFFEIGSSQGIAVSEILNSFGWRDIKVRKDYSRHDRIVEGTYESGRFGTQ